MGWPGLWKEVSEICKEVGIPDVNEVWVSKYEIKKSIFRHHLNVLTEQIQDPDKYKKMKEVQYDDFTDEQPYMHEKSLAVGRTAFKIRCQMLPGIPGNF